MLNNGINLLIIEVNNPKEEDYYIDNYSDYIDPRILFIRIILY